MKTKLFSFLTLLLWAVMAMAEAKPSVVPAMIVHGTDGGKQVVRLESTDVTDLIVLKNGLSLSVVIPETQVSGVRSITFAMIDAEEVATAVNSDIDPIVRSVEKVLRDGQVILRLQMHNGSILEYNIHGNKITNK